ncbi:MAG: acetoacetate--CoA ligase [Acidobacteria bacterium RIFCSPLOWO2_12_FULL_67_14b]|nr:MAG: acetoacetate--CoA ligase [Acidobacteria bacterium RIFCSPLOWO2_12_FULL_67_14b]
MDRPLWEPSPERIAATNLASFMETVEDDWNVTVADFARLWRFSIDEKERFWTSLKDFAQITAETWGTTVLEGPERMPGARWFPDARLNLAENLLRRRDGADAIVFRGEDRVRRRLSWAELHDLVSRLVQALRAAGVGPGDRVGAYLPNLPETVAVALATHAVGGVFSSCSPDFGAQGVLDRFGQIGPKVMIAADGYFYAGKTHDCLEKLAQILAGLPSVVRTVVVPYARTAPPLAGLRDAVLIEDFVADVEPGEIAYARLPFNHPAYILYSSGTTGAPKCIVHGAGGTLLKHASEHLLHCDVKPGDRVFYFTTCGWMMWNWLVSALACQATLLLYDGSPFHPDGNVLFDYADAEGMTLFGTSAKFIDAVAKAGLRPAKTHRLASVRTITSTGSPLAPESFDFVYQAIKRDVHLASISGGTDIVGCFMLGNPTGPVWRGEIQTRALGLAVDVFDDTGRPVRGRKGELVCTQPFPSMPVEFWNDAGGAKYRAAYFERFPGVWCHGDWVELTPHDGIVIYGRSDATLNPGGVRIGTAEIYRQVEQLDEVVESIVVGQDWEGDVRVVLFVVLRQGVELDAQLVDRIKARIRANCTPRHVPAKILQVADIPRTKSGKITELAVRDVIHGRAVKNVEALANPQALELYRGRPELET